MSHIDDDYCHYYFNGDYGKEEQHQEIEDYGNEEQHQENHGDDDENQENSLDGRFSYAETQKYRRIGLSGALRYLAHPAYQAHALFLTKSV